MEATSVQENSDESAVGTSDDTRVGNAPSEEKTLRQTAGPMRLLLTAIGGPREIGGKLTRIARTVALFLNAKKLGQRLTTLHERGYIDKRPGRAQIMFGGFDMLRFMIAPGARDYYNARGISFGLHQVLRFLDDPVSMIDPTGFLSDRDTIVGHVMQVVHLNPVYDLQLLEMFPDGLENLEAQVQAMVDGTHPRHRTIGAIVEDPGYHARLLDYVQRYREDPDTPALVRGEMTLREDPHFAAAERSFAAMPGYIAYCHKLPKGFWALLKRFRKVKRFPIELAPAA
jgi:hypothetical protein